MGAVAGITMVITLGSREVCRRWDLPLRLQPLQGPGCCSQGTTVYLPNNFRGGQMDEAEHIAGQAGDVMTLPGTVEQNTQRRNYLHNDTLV